nr:MAG TPA: hypothetical protein [Caudoviricetes sp.]
MSSNRILIAIASERSGLRPIRDLISSLLRICSFPHLSGFFCLITSSSSMIKSLSSLSITISCIFQLSITD